MDPRTQYILSQITARLPRRLSENLMMDDPIDVNYDGMNAELMKSKHIPAEAKRAMARAAKTQKSEKIINPRVARLIDEWYEREIKKAISDGILPPPVADDFIKRRAWKMQHRK